jgi:hypothetical protein
MPVGGPLLVRPLLGSLQPVLCLLAGEALIKLLEFVPVEEWLAHLACFMAEGAVWIDSESAWYARKRTKSQSRRILTT